MASEVDRGRFPPDPVMSIETARRVERPGAAVGVLDLDHPIAVDRQIAITLRIPPPRIQLAVLGDRVVETDPTDLLIRQLRRVLLRDREAPGVRTVNQ